MNRSECIPFAFRVYATYDVSAPLQDKELHSLIDRLNPDLRAIDTFDGKTRTKEFYAMTKEDAYALLESIAKLSGTMDKLQRLTPEGHEIADEEVAAEIQEEAKERKAPFSFIKCGIPMGAEVVLQNHPEVVAVVKMIGKLSIRVKPIHFLHWLKNHADDLSATRAGALALSGKKTARYSSRTRRSRFV